MLYLVVEHQHSLDVRLRCMVGREGEVKKGATSIKNVWIGKATIPNILWWWTKIFHNLLGRWWHFFHLNGKLRILKNILFNYIESHLMFWCWNNTIRWWIDWQTSQERRTHKRKPISPLWTKRGSANLSNESLINRGDYEEHNKTSNDQNLMFQIMVRSNVVEVSLIFSCGAMFDAAPPVLIQSFLIVLPVVYPPWNSLWKWINSSSCANEEQEKRNANRKQANNFLQVFAQVGCL